MEKEPVSTSRISGMKNKYVILVGACMLLLILGVAYIVCGLQYANTKKDMLASQEDAMGSWVQGTVEAVNLWTAFLEEQAKRVSTSELYRIFAEDVESMGAQTSSTINMADVKPSDLPEGAAALADQIPYMRNLLLDFMNFNGLTDARIVNARGHTVLSAMAQPIPVGPEQRETAERAISTGGFVFGPVRSASAGLVIDFADPLRAVLDADVAGSPVAALLLNRAVTGQIAQFLARDMRDANVMRPRLVQKAGEKWQELEVQSSTPIDLDPERLPLNTSGALPFGLRTALSGDGMVYSLGVPVPQLGWVVVLETPAAVLDGKLRAQGMMIYGIGALISLGVALALALLWWVMVGREQRAVAKKFEALYTVIKQQKRLLDSVNVSLDVGLLLADTDGNIQVCNRAFAEIVGKDEDELPGMNLNRLFEPAACANLVQGICKVVDFKQEDTLELALIGSHGDKLFRVTLFPFEDAEGDTVQAGSVAIFQDITEFRKNSERRRKQQANTIAALVHAVESVDPYLAGHSSRMTELAELIGDPLHLEQRDRETIRMAASLSQMGKLFIPRELLAKTGQLTPEEQEEITRAPEYANNVLRDIDFGLPVAKAVYEMNERMDGKGYPQQLAGEAISIHARILSVLNAFCAMVSPRSYRSGMPVETALERLRNDGSVDQQVVKALEDVLRTEAGKRVTELMRQK